MLRIGLVLGAGGPVGHAFHAGVLRALAAGAGWDPRRALLVLGTSAGAQVGALLRAGMDARDVSARVTGEPMSAEGERVAAHFFRPALALRFPRRYAPASAGYLRSLLRRPWLTRPGPLVAALLPEGETCLGEQASGLRRLFGETWPAQSLWITAVSMASGETVAFGRHGDPTTDVGTAVACSGAVPSLCKPVRVGDHRYVDGGIASATHLDLLERRHVDVALVCSPLSALPPMRLALRREVARLERRGVTVVSIEPREGAARVMGLNPMDPSRARAVAIAAYQTTLRELRERPELRDVLGDAS